MNERVLEFLREVIKIANTGLSPFQLRFQSMRPLSTAERMSRLSNALPDEVLTAKIQSYVQWLDLMEKSLPWLRRIARSYDLNLEIIDGCMFASLGNVRIRVESWEEFLICYEVFVLGEYRFNLGCPTVVIDFGLNVGISSLYFAGLSNVEKVYGFELFMPTYQAAVMNISLNPELSKKIVVMNYGVGSKFDTLNLAYDSNRKGCMGNHSVHKVNPDICATAIEKVKIHPASDEIRSIKQKHPLSKIVVKIDIEGGEYEVIDNVIESGSINEIDAILMEWHYRNPTTLSNKLINSGFSVHVAGDCQADAGMIYAFRTGSS